MEKVKKSLIIEKSKLPDNDEKYVLWLYSRTNVVNVGEDFSRCQRKIVWKGN